jgi:ABC-2 type transport system ATP-binding protein
MIDGMIDIQNLTKIFENKVAVSGMHLHVPNGSIFGFLGTNGAGKTTTIRAIMGHIYPDAGTVRTLGVDPWTLSETQKRQIAYVSENMQLPGWMTPERAVAFCKPLYPEWDDELAKTLLVDFDLKGAGPFKHLSTGQKRKTAIVLALCQRADLLVLDEPASGLDVSARHDFLHRLLDIACDGERSVFIASHLVSDLERIVDRIAFIHKGKLVVEGELDELKSHIREVRLHGDISQQTLGKTFSILSYKMDRAGTAAVVSNFDDERFVQFCMQHQCVEGAQHFGFNLEDLFVFLKKQHESQKADW